MAKVTLPTPEELRQLLRYDPETGKLFWLSRPRAMFKTDSQHKTWNARFAGVEAFTAVKSNGYRHGRIWGQHVYAHRAGWALVHGEWPSEQVDHINGDRADNRLSNLRAVSNAQNCMNRSLQRNNTTGTVGVYWHAPSARWTARVHVRGKQVSLGYFKSKAEAASARALAAKEYGFHENHGRGC